MGSEQANTATAVHGLRQTYPGIQQCYLSTAIHTNLATLDKVQNQAVWFINGVTKTTPTSACEIECNIEPLDIRRDAAIVTTYERYQRLEHHPNKALIQTWRKKIRIKQLSYLTRAATLLPEYNLSCSREKIATVAPQPLYRTAYQPTLCPHLIVKSASKAYPAHILKSLAAETIDTYPNTMTHVYTDGSALKPVEQAG